MTTRVNLLSKLAGIVFIAFATACDNGTSTARSNNDAAVSSATADQAGAAAPANQQQAPQPAASPKPAASVPDFTFFILKSGIRFTKEDLAKSGNNVFVFFDPTCGHCQEEAHDIGKNYDRVKSANFYFVSMNDPSLMASFLDTWAKPLVGKENVEMLYDRSADFINKFHVPSQYPATYVYGDDGELKEYWNGERDINEIIAAINK